jgi:hypothetical protein
MGIFRIKEPEDKKDAMLIFGGEEIRRLSKSLQDPGEGDVYTKLRDKLSEYFAPKKNVHYSIYMFLKMRPMEGECTLAYAARLREKAVNCDFHDINARILEQIIQTTDNTDLIRNVLHKNSTLQETLTEMQVKENTSMQVRAMGQQNTHDVAKISREKTYESKHTDSRSTDNSGICKYCNRIHPRQKELCPAYGKICSKCGKRNHFGAVCLKEILNMASSKRSCEDLLQIVVF